MREFIKRLLYFSLFLTGVIACIPMVIFIVPELVKIRELPPDDYSAIVNSQIIIAGDSRANRQLDPSLMHTYTSLNTINIAQDGHDLYAVSKILLALNLKNKMIILSASSWQLNDGAVKSGYFRLESFGDLSFADKLRLYKKDIPGLYENQVQRFWYIVKYGTSILKAYNHTRKMNAGFEKISCANQKEADAGFFKNHPFYTAPHYDGVKKKLLIKALYNLSQLKSCKILIYNAPVTNRFRIAARKNGVYNLELKYDNTMQALVQGYTPIKYVSFISDNTIPDENFYDPQHLCGKGIPIFTKTIAAEIKRSLVIY